MPHGLDYEPASQYSTARHATEMGDHTYAWGGSQRRSCIDKQHLTLAPIPWVSFSIGCHETTTAREGTASPASLSDSKQRGRCLGSRGFSADEWNLRTTVLLLEAFWPGLTRALAVTFHGVDRLEERHPLHTWSWHGHHSVGMVWDVPYATALSRRHRDLADIIRKIDTVRFAIRR